ncbi:MAG: hypothetical protein HGA85_04830, partial [Nanoarchaeota archaeon]|nr:hypothetical protein [Nanoarchaeota archaeon]
TDYNTTDISILVPVQRSGELIGVIRSNIPLENIFAKYHYEDKTSKLYLMIDEEAFSEDLIRERIDKNALAKLKEKSNGYFYINTDASGVEGGTVTQLYVFDFFEYYGKRIGIFSVIDQKDVEGKLVSQLASIWYTTAVEIVFFIIITLLTAFLLTSALKQKISEKTHELNQLNENLEKLVHARTSELEASKISLEQNVYQRTKEIEEKLAELENTKLAIMNILEDTDETNKSLILTKKQLNNKVTQMEEMNKKKDEFISITAHELKTPLTSIKGFADLLKNEKILENKALRDQYFNIIIEDTQRLSKLITDMLDLTRIDLGTMKFYFEKSTTEEIISQLKNLVELQVKAKGISFDIKVEKGMPASFIDKSRLLQVLSNLVNNSMKYTEKGHIMVEAFKKGDYLHYRVSDTGVGIPANAQSRIFQRFFQADSSYTRKVGGTGLGLSICKGIVEALGGKIWFTSRPGKTVFEFTIKHQEEVAVQQDNLKVV